VFHEALFFIIKWGMSTQMARNVKMAMIGGHCFTGYCAGMTEGRFSRRSPTYNACEPSDC
jgi:hypothetical protein